MSEVAAELRASTRAEHRRVEARLGLCGSVLDEDDLAAVLQGLLRVWEPLERALAVVAGWESRGLDPHLGESADLLRADLVALGRPAGPTPPARAAPTDLATATGARYVLLGSALGGPTVAAALERTLAAPARHATRFFRRSGRDPRADWQRLRVALAGVWHPAERVAMIDGARRTFALVADSEATVEARRRGPGSPPVESV